MHQPKVTFSQKVDPFYEELKKRVEAYMQSADQPRHAGSEMRKKTLILVGLYLFFAILVYSNKLPSWGLIISLALWQFVQFLMTIGIAHDAAHNCYAISKKANRRIMYIFDFFGINSKLWINNHLFSHHGMPNVPLLDSAIESFSLVRLHPKTKQTWAHQYQHWYMFLVYSMVTIFQAYFLEFVSFYQDLVGFKREDKDVRKTLLYMIINKLFVLGHSLILPLIFLDAPVSVILTGWFLGHMISGIAIGIIFQTTHIHRYTQFIEPDENGVIHDSYARHILKTTAEFSTDSYLATWISGGLNLHVTHHLFPNISQVHLMALSKIVKQTAQEFGLKYYEYNLVDAIISHIKMLKELGQMPSYSAKMIKSKTPENSYA